MCFLKNIGLAFYNLFIFFNVMAMMPAIASDCDVGHAPAAAKCHRTIKDIPYLESHGDAHKADRCALDIHFPEDGKNLPVVIMFHAGGLVGGKREIPHELQNQGIIVVAPGYRLSPEVKAPAYIEDASAAVAWVFRHIADYGGSPDRIFLSGASAGGYLAALVGLDKQYLAAHGIDANRLAAIAPITGQMTTHFTVRAERGVGELCTVVDNLAPLHHVRKDAPPILLVTGDREIELLGRYEENAFFLRMLRLAGHKDNILHELPGHDHAATGPAGNRILLEFVRQRSP